MNKRELNKIIEESRRNIEKYDDKIFALLYTRFINSETIGMAKHILQLPVTDEKRFNELIERQVKKYNKKESTFLSEDFIRKIYDVIHEESCKIQENYKNLI